VVATGRLSEAKDFPLLVQAHARVLAAGVDHRLVIMGEGQERPTIEAAIERFGVGGSVTLAGFVEEPGRVLADADLFVLSSRSEGLPLSLLEALVLGVPVVSTRCGAGPDLILEGGRYGRLVPVGDVQALAAAIEDHLRRPAVLEEKASGGPLRAAAFDAGGAAGAVLDVLHDLTRQRARVSAAGPG
jgi:glycosyltransferase involved in cell wall biosynthesis